MFPSNNNESRVLCLYAGGTIGMVRSNATSGFAPYPSFLTETLRSQTRFHDPKGDSIFSWSDTADRYKAWSDVYTRPSSGTATPRSQAQKEAADGADVGLKYDGARDENKAKSRPSLLHGDSAVGSASSQGLNQDDGASEKQAISPDFGHAIDVFSSAPTGTSTHHAFSSSLTDNYKTLRLSLPTLVTPPGVNGKRVRYAVLEYDPLLDSSEMDIPDWIRLASDISLNYRRFDAFIVLHGTDTMAYTSSALSMLLENLGKTVILTGAQVPLSQLRNDAIENLLGALTLAGSYIIPEVTLYFASTLYRGNRASKISNTALAAFDSPNMPPLARVSINIDVAWPLISRPHALLPFHAHDNMSPNVAVLRLFPGLSTSTVRSFLSAPLAGAVLESFGAGNAPSRPDLLEVFEEATRRGCVIVNITQCLQGEVSGIYAVGKKLEKVGVVAGGDMTPECALAKLSYLLGKQELEVCDVRRLMGRSLRGELTVRESETVMQHPTVDQDGDSVGPGEGGMATLLAHILRRPTAEPEAAQSDTVSYAPENDNGKPKSSSNLSLTQTEADTTTALTTILPYLIHRAAVLNDLPALESHISALSSLSSSSLPLSTISTTSPSSITPNATLPPIDRAHALHAASALGHVEVEETLLKAGASVHVRDYAGRSVLDVVGGRGVEGKEVVGLLKGAGAHGRVGDREDRRV